MPSGVPVTGKRASRGSRSTEGTFYVVRSAQRKGGKVIKQKVVIIPRCSHLGCEKGAVSGGLPGLCISHGGGRRCRAEGCPKSAAGPTHFCVSHGGGKRCAHEGCTRQPNRGGFCANHGTARCKFPDCTKVEKGGGYCCKHGGGRRCAFEGCNKHNVGGGFCIAHGGGKRCTFEGCTRQDVGGELCRLHGGGFQCEEPGCTKFSLSAERYCRGHLKARSLIDAMLSAAMVDPEEMAVISNGGSFASHSATNADAKISISVAGSTSSSSSSRTSPSAVSSDNEIDQLEGDGDVMPALLHLAEQRQASTATTASGCSTASASGTDSTTSSLPVASRSDSRASEHDIEAASDLGSITSAINMTMESFPDRYRVDTSTRMTETETKSNLASLCDEAAQVPGLPIQVKTEYAAPAGEYNSAVELLLQQSSATK